MAERLKSYNLTCYLLNPSTDRRQGTIKIENIHAHTKKEAREKAMPVIKGHFLATRSKFKFSIREIK